MLRNFSHALIGQHVQKFITFGLYQGWANLSWAWGGWQRNAIQDFCIFHFKFYPANPTSSTNREVLSSGPFASAACLGTNPNPKTYLLNSRTSVNLKKRKDSMFVEYVKCD